MFIVKHFSFWSCVIRSNFVEVGIKLPIILFKKEPFCLPHPLCKKAEKSVPMFERLCSQSYSAMNALKIAQNLGVFYINSDCLCTLCITIALHKTRQIIILMSVYLLFCQHQVLARTHSRLYVLFFLFSSRQK